MNLLKRHCGRFARRLTAASRLVTLVTLAMACRGIAGEPPPPAAIEIAKRSLPFVQEKGVDWIEGRSCTSCHQVPAMLWSLNSAARAGLDIDRKELAERADWAVDWRHWLQSGAKEGVDKASAGNIETMAFLLLARDSETEQGGEWRREFRTHLLKNQQLDGSWKSGGQLPLGKRPARETTEVTTMWTLLALNSYDAEATPPEIRTRADAFLAAAEPGRSTEWHVARLLLKPGDETRRAELLKQQHPDGGWGWLSAGPSDAYGTGLALYALARSGLPASDKTIEHAIEFLKSTQQPDGSWPVPSTRAKDKDKVIPTSRYWGTSWAVIGLLESQRPPAAPSPSP